MHDGPSDHRGVVRMGHANFPWTEMKAPAR